MRRLLGSTTACRIYSTDRSCWQQGCSTRCSHKPFAQSEMKNTATLMLIFGGKLIASPSVCGRSDHSSACPGIPGWPATTFTCSTQESRCSGVPPGDEESRQPDFSRQKTLHRLKMMVGNR